MSRRRRALRYVAGIAALAAVLTVGAVVAQHRPPPAVAAPPLPPGFREQIVLSGLGSPTNLEIAPDGRIFVAEKRGIIKVFDGVGDTSPVTFADLRADVFEVGDRGLLGMALAPNFPANPWVYVLYTRNATVGGVAPKYPDDKCPNLYDGTCVVSGRLARLQAAGNTTTGQPQTLLDGWCQQYPSHSLGDLAFGTDGALYVTGGDGASYSTVDFGQKNVCGDPPGGAALTPPAAQGGALRAQDVRTTADPTGYNGSILRLDPNTGKPLATNPGAGDETARRVVGYGLRNPYRMAVRPVTAGKAAEVWIGDVGWGRYEEVNRLPVAPTSMRNFGWPCYEGPEPTPGYVGANLTLCESLYPTNPVIRPHYAFRHADQVVPGEVCPSGGASISGLAFYPSTATTYPAEYRNALFFADYARQCIWTMFAGADGVPSPSKIRTFTTSARPVDLEVGPDTLLYYVDLGGTVRRFRYFVGNQPPIAAFSASPFSGAPPLAVTFDATSSMDPDPADANLLTYEWDFDYDAAAGFSVDATGRTATYTYPTEGIHHAALRVKDGTSSDIAVRDVDVAAGKPTAVISSPTPTDTWAAGQTIQFSGYGEDEKDGRLESAQALQWQLILNHCYPGGACHAHPGDTFTGPSGSFVAPDHEYPAYLELRLTVTDSEGKQSVSSVAIEPRTARVTLTASPSGSPLTFGGDTLPTPFSQTAIVGTSITVSAPTALTLPGGRMRVLAGWSDGGAPTHTIVVPESNVTYTARYRTCAGTYGRACGPIPPPGKGTPPRESLPVPEKGNPPR